ncbi:hypothetical protein C8A05DRAFT_19949, partial [Staphylotrichum tortipilum]
ISSDIKHDNILVNWTSSDDGTNTITNVALGDFLIAFKSGSGKPRQTPYAVGNFMWQSPERQTGRGLTKAFDMVCIYALGGGELLLLGDEYVELAKHGIPPEQEILSWHFSYFGPVNEGLLKQVNDEDWSAALRAASELAEWAVRDVLERRFEVWGSDLEPKAQDMIAGLTRMDPARLTADQCLAHPWWQGEGWWKLSLDYNT